MASVGLIVGDPSTVAAGDSDDILRGLLTGMGHTVTLRAATADATTVAASHAFLVFAPLSGTAQGALGTDYHALGVPMVVCANSRTVWADCFRLCNAGQTGTNRTWDIYDTAVGDPLAAGYSGGLTVWSGSSTQMTNYFTAGLPGGATRVANQNDDPTRATLFVVPAGEPLWNPATSAFDGNTTHGWRGGISAAAVNVSTYRTAAWENLFRALVEEAETHSAPPVAQNKAPTASYTITPAQSVDLGTVVTATLSGTDPDGTIAAHSHTLGIPAGSAATLSSTTAAAATFAPDVAGTYVLTGRVRDNAGAWSPTITRTVNAAAVAPPAGDVTVRQFAEIDLRGIAPSAGGALTYSLAFTSGDNSAPLTEVEPGLYRRTNPKATTTYTYTVTEASGATTTGQAAIVIAEGQVLEDVFVKIQDDPALWALVNRPGNRVFGQDGAELDPVTAMVEGVV